MEKIVVFDGNKIYREMPYDGEEGLEARITGKVIAEASEWLQINHTVTVLNRFVGTISDNLVITIWYKE